MTTEEEVKKMIEEWEGETQDFKSFEILSHSNDLAELMVAFGNNKFVSSDYGGKIIIGVNNEKTIETFEEKQGHEESIMNIARDKCYPSINPKFENIEINSDHVYVITIPKMTNTPYQLITKNGKTHRIRVGSTIREPTSQELESLYGNSAKNDDEKFESIISKFPSSSNPFRHFTVIPLDSNSKLLEFDRDTVILLKNMPPIYTNIAKRTLIQNEIHYTSNNFPSSDTAWAILNDFGCFSCMEMMGSTNKRIHIGREIVFLFSMFQYIKNVFKEIGYDQRILINYRHNGVQNYSFSTDDISDVFYMTNAGAQISDFTIQRTVSIKSLNVKTVVCSILEEIARACDWPLESGAFDNYVDKILKKVGEIL